MVRNSSQSPASRRGFIKLLALSVLALPVLKWLGSESFAADTAPPAGTAPASETDPVASAIGYKADKGKVDPKRYPQIKKPAAKTQFCENCALYTKLNGGWGKCTMIANGAVAAKGWCGSWQKKA